MMEFYLGTSKPLWLWAPEPKRHKLFVSTRTLYVYRKMKPANIGWALDSGGFTELNMYGTWRTSPQQYIEYVYRYVNEIGLLEWASQQDWMCEPFVLKKTGKTIEEHQQLTIDNFLTLRNTAPDLPFIPVLQGWTPDDYLRHVDMFAAAGVNLTEEPRVGIGSVCRRANSNQMAKTIIRLHNDGLKLHGFGIKTLGLMKYGFALTSSDSLAWSYSAMYADGKMCHTEHNAKKCSNCMAWAELWADDVVLSIDTHKVDNK